MRLHDFECQDCKHKFEELVGADEETVECPECGSTKTKRLLSGFHSGASSSSGGSSACVPRGGFS